MTIAAAILLGVLTALTVREAWMGYPPPRFSGEILNRREQAFLQASSEAFFPTGDGLPSGDDAGVVRYLDSMLTQVPGRQRWLIRALFIFVEHGALIFGPVRSRITRQSVADRVETFRGWECSDLYLRRMSFLSLRTLMTLAYFGDPTVLDTVATTEGS